LATVSSTATAKRYIFHVHVGSVGCGIELHPVTRKCQGKYIFLPVGRQLMG
jgi:hypothetical protein